MTTSFAALPPLAALFLTHFDDIKGQSVIFYASLPDLTPGTIEHTTLPSGLHQLDSDLVLFTHHDLPGAGVFRSQFSDEGSRGRRMGTLGAVLASPAVPEDLFVLQQPLSALFDKLEALETSPFAPSSSAAPSSAVSLLSKIWQELRANSHPNTGQVHIAAVGRARRLISDAPVRAAPEHPIAYMPSLLGVLGPTIVSVYKAVLSGQRIILYSTPPLLPLAAFAWCIWAMSIAPASATDAHPSIWLGNIGLMDMEEVKRRQDPGGWVATTSDAIYRSHHDVYDIFIDMSSIPLSMPSELPSAPTLIVSSTYHQPKRHSVSISYTFGDLPLYRSLLLLTSSPPTVHAGVSKTGGWWLLAFEVAERAWKLCVGVCEFAIGRGQVGDSSTNSGPIHLDDGEEDARLLDPEVDQDLLAASQEPDDVYAPIEEDEAVRRGRLMFRQLQHNTYHLHARLCDVLDSRSMDISSLTPLTYSEMKQLTGGWPLSSAAEGQFWKDAACVWGLTVIEE